MINIQKQLHKEFEGSFVEVTDTPLGNKLLVISDTIIVHQSYNCIVKKKSLNPMMKFLVPKRKIDLYISCSYLTPGDKIKLILHQEPRSNAWVVTNIKRI